MSGLLRRRTVKLHNHRRPPFPTLLHDYIVRRDKECVAAKLGFVHECRDRFGVPHAPYAIPLLTMEHVHEGYGKAGVRAENDAKHVVALCGLMNNRPPSREMRNAFRAYLAEVEP